MKFIVFDLDLTLWDCDRSLWCDCTTPPYRLTKDADIFDSRNTHIRLYPDVRDILATLKSTGHDLALASRTSAPDQASDLLELFEIKHYFSHSQIYPGDKQAHFSALQVDTDLTFEEMIFFDDELQNIDSVSELGVHTIHVPHGLSWENLPHDLIP